MSTRVYQYTQQGEKLISYICGHRENKKTKRKITFFNNHVDVSKTTFAFLIFSFPSSNVTELRWEQNFGDNTEELYSDVFIIMNICSSLLSLKQPLISWFWH